MMMPHSVNVSSLLHEKNIQLGRKSVIDVEIYSDDPDDHVLVDRYWAMNEDGKFKENVADLLLSLIHI